ncbi:hypothetical protein ACLOJK_038950 [Asimina triloba]
MDTSFPSVDPPWCWSGIALLKKATGCSSCIRTAPTLVPNASHSMVNGLLKSGGANISGDSMADFNSWKSMVAEFVGQNALRSRSC